MIGRMCRFYKFSDDHCLKMLASRFFLLYENISKLEGEEYAHQCYVSRASALTNEGFQSTVTFFENMGQKEERPKDIDLEKYRMVDPLPANNEATKTTVLGVFALDRKIERKVLMEKIENPHPRRLN